MVAVRITNERGFVLVTPMVPFATADELEEWLGRFVQTPKFKTALEDLRFAATEPVDARLERENGMATLATVPPDIQEALDDLPVQRERDLELELNDGEPVPDAGALRRLNAAGLRFEIRSPTITGRTVRMHVVKSASPETAPAR
jgi:hypothetical protein